MSTDTIAAVGTALSNSGISIIRISGDKSLTLIQKIFDSKHKIEPNHIVYGKIKDKDIVLDTVLVSYFKAPYSFTGEDICEINCHGGNEITKEILSLVLSKGARLADPGEFSKRAFLNGKMDLSQAEAVIHLITAKTSTQTKIAAGQMEGNLSNKIKALREELIELLAHIEVSVDYPEYDYDEVDPIAVKALLERKLQEITHLMDTYEQGKIIKEGVQVAILGKPNVGKSSLLNCLANYEKAIVTDIAGTTRDVIEETVNIGDLVLNIADTAGIRETDDVIEKIGVERSLQKLEEVDLVIYMFSAEEKIENDDLELLSKIQNKGLKNIVLINKMDKVQKSIFETFLDELEQNGAQNILPISVSTGEGIENLKKYIVSLFLKQDFDFSHELMITNTRHKELLRQAVVYIQQAKDEIQKGQPIDIIGIYIKSATKQLGEIIGMDVSEDVVHKIFEKFCLGK